MDTFNFLTYFGGKILPNTVYSIDEVDLINALGANPATSRIDEILELCPLILLIYFCLFVSQS